MSVSSPAVSVIMPCFRVAEYIPDALQSLFAQTRTDFEVVVVNDGCPETAALEAAIEPWRSRIVYVKQANGGVAAARNTAVRASSAPLIAQLDPDDMWEPNYLEVQLAFLKDHPSVDVVYPNATYIGDTPHAGMHSMDLYPSEREITFMAVVQQRCHVLYSVTARREALEKAGLFDPALRSAEDLDLWLRVLYTGGKIAWHDQPLLKYRSRPGSLTQDPKWIEEHFIQVLRKCAATMQLSDSDRDVLQRTIQRAVAELDFLLGRRALSAGDIATARDHITSANAYLQRPKLSALLWMLRLHPAMAQSALRFYDSIRPRLNR